MESVFLPLLTEDGSRLDWRDAEYRAEVEIRPFSATITHQLQQAPTLTGLVAAGLARWATELRCPKTLYSSVEEAAQARQVVSWKPEDVDGDLYVIPGLVALSAFDLRPGNAELGPIWADQRLRVSKGSWLARGFSRRTRSLGQSLLKFHRDEGLEAGRMWIQPAQEDDDLFFYVHLADDIWPERYNRHLQVSALIGAMGHMVPAFEDPDDEPRIVQEIRGRLEGQGIPTWTDRDRYDPASAATVLEPFIRTTELAVGDPTDAAGR